MEFMDQIMGYLQPVLDFFMPGLVAHAGDGSVVNWMPLGIQLGVIALVLALLMREFGAILIFTVVGVIIHVIVDNVMPIVRGGESAADFDFAAFGAQFTQTDYLLYLGALAAGYFLSIIVLSIVKGIFFRGD
ncbi:hypothetical protein [Maricaulis sp.]|uniref:hypothetical protein n=1 Tax=unclassified Maricaulis TaxID=2632371 RepID=UPI001B273C3A|nr:hypothetical protein [Maricaulis sp.]MBO6798134.1 hypothetical protein [Maricaulis sp.]